MMTAHHGSRRVSWIGLIAVGMASLGWGLFLGVVVLRPPSQPVAERDVNGSPPAAEPATTTGDSLTTFDAQETVKRADFLLQYGNLRDAIDLYRQALPRFEPGQHGWLIYRLAVANELLGDVDQALQWYQRLQEEQSDPTTQVLAAVGRARVMTRAGNVRRSQHLLRNLESDAAFAAVPAPLQRTISHLLAQAYAIDVASSIPPSRTWQAVPDLSPTPDSLLQAFIDPVGPVETSPPPPTQFDVTLQLASHAEETYISCFLPAVRMDDVVSQLAAAVGVSLEITERASQRLSSRLQHLAFDNVSVASALDAILDPVDLMWREESGQLTVRTTDEEPPDRIREWKIYLARRAITRALVLASDDELSLNTRFLQASVEVAAGQWDAARSIYDEILHRKSSLTDMVAWWFNYADVLFRLGQPSSAIDAYYQVVDHTSQTSLTAIAYGRIGQILLDEGRYEESLRPLIRGVSLATEPDVQAAAAISLASAYLLSDNPRAAHTALTEARNSIRGGDYRYQGNLLEALCRDRISHDPTEASRIRRNLFSSVSRIDPEELVTDVEWLLLGEAYDRMGLTGEVERLFTHSRTLPLAPHVAAEIEERLVQQYIASHELEKAQELLSRRLDDPDPRQAMGARLHRASILLLQERSEDCIDACRQILTLDPTEEEKLRVLQLMGQAYQFRQQFDRAALCFAGLLPALGDHP